MLEVEHPNEALFAELALLPQFTNAQALEVFLDTHHPMLKPYLLSEASGEALQAMNASKLARHFITQLKKHGLPDDVPAFLQSLKESGKSLEADWQEVDIELEEFFIKVMSKMQSEPNQRLEPWHCVSFLDLEFRFRNKSEEELLERLMLVWQQKHQFGPNEIKIKTLCGIVSHIRMGGNPSFGYSYLIPGLAYVITKLTSTPDEAVSLLLKIASEDSSRGIYPDLIYDYKRLGDEVYNKGDEMGKRKLIFMFHGTGMNVPAFYDAFMKRIKEYEEIVERK